MNAPPSTLPTIGQLKSGWWAVFNMQDTPLWDKTFPTRADAVTALCLYSMSRRVKGDVS